MPFFGLLSRNSFLVNKGSLFLPKCQYYKLFLLLYFSPLSKSNITVSQMTFKFWILIPENKQDRHFFRIGVIGRCRWFGQCLKENVFSSNDLFPRDYWRSIFLSVLPIFSSYSFNMIIWPDCPLLPPTPGHLCVPPTSANDCHYNTDHCCCGNCPQRFTFSCAVDSTTGAGLWEKLHSSICPAHGCGKEGELIHIMLLDQDQGQGWEYQSSIREAFKNYLADFFR